MGAEPTGPKDKISAAQPDSTEQLIVDSAAACIKRFGIRRTTIEEVARVARLSRASVYRHFANKDALLEAVFSRESSRFVSDVLEAIRLEPTLADAAATHAVLTRRHIRDTLLLGLEATEPETVALMFTRDAAPMYKRWIELWKPLIREAVARGEVRADIDVAHAAEWILRMLISLTVTPPVTFDGEDDEQLRRFVTDHLVRGLR